jgi:hypothetical protein
MSTTQGPGEHGGHEQKLRDERDEMRRDGLKHTTGFDEGETRQLSAADEMETEPAQRPETD